MNNHSVHIGTFNRGSGNEIRVTGIRDKGNRYLNILAWSQTDGDAWKPASEAVTFEECDFRRLRHAIDLVEALPVVENEVLD